ncbi:MAG: beta-ketoacyl-[acyl-carrier-protein] synthase family protein [Deltaproteobacteria bacterium]|nr:beta-ketoacyl-[acyl-carrier-protein] synthase family protein [Deltaproteobacteria bacterium]
MTFRAVITGLGALTGLGQGVETQVRCLRDGVRHMDRPGLFEVVDGGPVSQVAEDHLPELPEGHESLSSRASRLALAAVDEALAGAGLDAGTLDATALYVGTTCSGILEGEVALRGVEPGDPRPEYRHFDDQYVAGAVGRTLARIRSIRGPRLTLSTACSSSANALAQAAAGIEQGRFEAAVVLGVDSLTRLTYHGFGSLGLVSPVPCRPFDAGRKGLTLGEGAACLVLESPQGARSRGADVLAGVLGWARNVDGHHITQPDPEGRGIEACIRTALAHAGVEAGDIDHVNAHGTGTPQNDLMEGTVIGRVLGPAVPVTSTKSYTGHTLGAAGAVEALYSVLALQGGFVPATLGLEEVDHRLDVNVVAGSTLDRGLDRVLSNSFGFGGNNCCLILGGPEVS